MINIFLASLSVGVGSYLIRKGDLFKFIIFLIKWEDFSINIFIYTFIGILLNLLGIYFWQSSAKSAIPFSVAYSSYLSLSIIFGIIVSYLFEKINLGVSFFVGCSFVIAGLIILSYKA